MSAAHLSGCEMGTLLRECAEAMDDEDGRRIRAGEVHFHAVVSHPTTVGREICERVAASRGLVGWGEIAYYLLVHTWNDALDWAEREIGSPWRKREEAGHADAAVP